MAVWFGELDEPQTEGQLLVRALDPELVWLAHEHEPWRLPHRLGITPGLAWPPGSYETNGVTDEELGRELHLSLAPVP